jgi:hypothetical protein
MPRSRAMSKERARKSISRTVSTDLVKDRSNNMFNAKEDEPSILN